VRSEGIARELHESSRKVPPGCHQKVRPHLPTEIKQPKRKSKRNPKTFRIFSPDELVSNKLDAVLEVTSRNFQWDEETRAEGGRIIEILSEHTCQGMLQGYTLTGRTGLFPSYEAFLGIIHTMMIQYAKFIKMASESAWRKNYNEPSINYIETSTWARQEHNGFSHQNPGFIGAVLELKSKIARVYFPPDANCFLSTVSHCLRAKGYVNLMVGSKQPTPVWLTPEEANTVSFFFPMEGFHEFDPSI